MTNAQRQKKYRANKIFADLSDVPVHTLDDLKDDLYQQTVESDIALLQQHLSKIKKFRTAKKGLRS